MPKVRFSDSDLLASNQLDANWYKLTVKGLSEWKPGKSDPTSNVIEADFVVKEGPKAGTPLKHWFSEKSIGTSFDSMAPFVKSFTDVNAGKDYELSDVIGRDLLGYVVYNSERKANEIREFRNINFRATTQATGGTTKP